MDRFLWVVCLGIFIAGSSVLASAATYEEAGALYGQDQFEQARDAIEDFIRTNPADPNMEDALYLLARANDGLKDAQMSIQCYENLLNQYPNTTYAATARFTIARNYEILNQQNMAIQKFEEFLAHHPDSADAAVARFNLARNYEAVNQPEKAIQMYEDLLVHHPDTDDAAAAWFNLARNYGAADQLETAIQKYEDLIARNPDSSNAHYARFILAYAYGKLNRPEDAMEQQQIFLQKYFDAKPTDQAHIKLIDAYFGVGDFEQAKTQAVAFMERFPDSELIERAQYDLIRALIKLGPMDAVSQRVDEFLAARPNHAQRADLLWFKARSNQVDGNWEEAVRGFDAMLEADPSPALRDRRLLKGGTAHVNYARALRNAAAEKGGGDTAEVEQYETLGADMLREFLSQPDLDIDDRQEARYYLEDFNGIVQDSMSYLESHQEHDRGWLKALMWLGRARAHQDDLTGAAEAFDAILGADPSGVEMPGLRVPEHLALAATWRAWIAQRQGDEATVKSVLRSMQLNIPDNKIKDEALKQFASFVEDSTP